jgi:hypothetical protein
MPGCLESRQYFKSNLGPLLTLGDPEKRHEKSPRHEIPTGVEAQRVGLLSGKVELFQIGPRSFS